MNSKRRSIFISGPCRGIDENNYPAFHRVAAILREFGHEVYSPAEFPWSGEGEFPLNEAMSAFFWVICREACSIMMLPGWEQSKGARAEYAAAECVGLDIFQWRDVEAQP